MNATDGVNDGVKDGVGDDANKGFKDDVIDALPGPMVM